MINRFKKERDPFFKSGKIIDTFVFNHNDFDVIVIHWGFCYGKRREEILDLLGNKGNNWNIYIRFKPSFPNFDKLPDDYNEFDVIDFSGGATFYKPDGCNRVYGNDYMHFGDDDVMNCDKFDENNRCFVDAHKIIEQLEEICKRN